MLAEMFPGLKIDSDFNGKTMSLDPVRELISVVLGVFLNGFLFFLKKLTFPKVRPSLLGFLLRPYSSPGGRAYDAQV